MVAGGGRPAHSKRIIPHPGGRDNLFTDSLPPGNAEPQLGPPGSAEPQLGQPGNAEPQLGQPGNAEPQLGPHRG